MPEISNIVCNIITPSLYLSNAFPCSAVPA
jgi:hypothetical protein